MIKAGSRSQTDFYREFLMRRGDYSPLEFGIELTREALMDLLVEEFNLYFRDQMTVDELVLNPSITLRSAMKFATSTVSIICRTISFSARS